MKGPTIHERVTRNNSKINEVEFPVSTDPLHICLNVEESGCSPTVVPSAQLCTYDAPTMAIWP